MSILDVVQRFYFLIGSGKRIVGRGSFFLYMSDTRIFEDQDLLLPPFLLAYI